MISYKSTRGGESQVCASRAILNGIACDGGLYVPDRIPALPLPPEELADLTYPALAQKIMQPFLPDFTPEELAACINAAYGTSFDTPEIAPLHEADGMWFLELFHGKTIAFKDMALSVLPHLMTVSAGKNELSDRIVILTATSGDTGKAAMAGFADVPGTEIIVFYPKDGVSPVQERQMLTQAGENTHVVAIRGNFDDAQNGVKKIFGDEAFADRLRRAGYRFSSANSINIGRLLPQIVYYVHAYTELMRRGVLSAGEQMDVTVPTGNFGNILAAWYAKQMGLPIRTLVCASNENKVLFDFFRTGDYDRNRPFHLTSSPSMDILVSSNLERLLYHAAGEDAAQTEELMRALSLRGQYRVSSEMREAFSDFYGGYAQEEEVFRTIGRIFRDDHYLLDPHTAVAATVANAYLAGCSERVPMVVASTASPYKFGRSVLHAVDADRFDGLSDDEQFEAIREISGVPVPPAIRELSEAPVRHDTVCDVAQMADVICSLLHLDQEREQ